MAKTKKRVEKVNWAFIPNRKYVNQETLISETKLALNRYVVSGADLG